jgi:putative membrane protein
MWDGTGDGWWWMMAIGWFVLLALGVLAVVTVRILAARSSEAASGHPSTDQVLAERYARGEIDELEFRRRREALRG